MFVSAEAAVTYIFFLRVECLKFARETNHVGLIHLRYVRQSEIHMKIWLSR